MGPPRPDGPGPAAEPWGAAQYDGYGSARTAPAPQRPETVHPGGPEAPMDLYAEQGPARPDRPGTAAEPWNATQYDGYGSTGTAPAPQRPETARPDGPEVPMDLYAEPGTAGGPPGTAAEPWGAAHYDGYGSARTAPAPQRPGGPEAPMDLYAEPWGSPEHGAGPRRGGTDVEPREPAPWDGTDYGVEPYADAVGDGGVRPEEGGRRRRKGRRWLVSGVLVLVLLIGVAVFQLVRPLPEPMLQLTTKSAHTFPGGAPRLPWPGQGQAAVDVEGLGTMGTNGPATPTPTASVAKVMTAYVFLTGHPLKPGEDGPTFTVSPEEAARLPLRKQRDESLVEVTAGQRFTERKALEALMIVSANNIAHELARWDAGSLTAFVAKMNATARELGMDSTTYTDPSGYDPRTVSTAADQVKLLRAAMRIPAFAEIVSTRSYVSDTGETRPGGNILLGRYGFVGGKTGYTDLAGGNYVFAARRNVDGTGALIVGAVLNQPTGNGAMPAMTAAQRLVVAAGGAMTSAVLAEQGARVGRIDDGLGGGAPLVAARRVTVIGWPGLTVRVSAEGAPPRTAAAGHRVGTLITGAARTELRLQHRLDEPSPLSRLIRRDPPRR